MKLSTAADYTAASAQCAGFIETALAAGQRPAALAEAMTQTGIATLARELGPADAATYVLVVLRLLGEAGDGH